MATLVRTWRALPRPDSRPEPRDAAEWLRAHGVTLAAVTLIAVQLCWNAALLGHSYFRQDDYFTFDRALASGFTWKYLMFVDAGHMSPLGFAIAWVLARVSLYSWPLTSVVTLMLLAGACFALLRMLRTLFGNRPAILIPLVVYLFSPLSLAGLAWWSVGIEALPLELAIFMAVHSHVRYLRDGRLRNAVAAAGWLLLGMATMEKGAIVPLLLLALTSGFFVEGRWAAATVTAVRRYWRAWVLYGVLLAGYCAVFFVQLPGSSTQPSSPGPVSHLLDFASTLGGSTLLPGALGGPWQWSVVGYGYAQASPPAALQQLSWAVAAIVVVVSCACRVRAWRAWAILLGWIVAADMVPVVIGRLGTQPAALLGVQARYLTDATSVLALCLALAFLPLAGEQAAYRFRLPAARPAGDAGPGGDVGGGGDAGGDADGGGGAAGIPAPAGTVAALSPPTGPTPAALTRAAAVRSMRAVTLLVLCAFLVGSFWSLQAFEGVTMTASARSYIATAQVAVAGAPRGTLIVDGPTPAMIMDPALFWTQGYTSQVIGAIARGEPARHLSWTLSPDGAAGRLMIFDDAGRLRPAAVEGPSSGPPPHKRRCWAVTSVGTSIPLRGSLYRWPWTARLEYSGPATVLAVSFGGKWSEVKVPAGTHAVYVRAVGAGRTVSVLLVGPGARPARGDAPAQPPAAAACVTGVTVGSLHPGQVSQAIPAAPVPG